MWDSSDAICAAGSQFSIGAGGGLPHGAGAVKWRLFPSIGQGYEADVLLGYPRLAAGYRTRAGIV